MIIHHKNHKAAFTGAHNFYSVFQQQRVSVTTGAPPVGNIIGQSRSTFRFVFSRVHGRVN